MMERDYILFEKQGMVKISKAVMPEPRSNQVLIKTICSMISAGTELNYYEGKHSDFKAGKISFPKAPGYSAIGEIVKFGSADTGGFKVGERVLAMSGHSSMSLPDIQNLTKVPENLDSDDAVYGIIGSVSLHGIREANIKFGENVLITGLGIIGQIALRLARLSPARNIIVADTYDIRLEAAEKGGADHCVNLNKEDLPKTVEEITSGRGCEVIIEASGNTKAVSSALTCASKRGRIVILGCPHGTAELDLYTQLQKKEISIIGSYQPLCPRVETAYAQWTQQRNREIILEYLNRGKLDFSSITTHKMPYRQAGELYSLLSRHKDKSIGAIIDWENDK